MKATDLIGRNPQLWRAAAHHTFYEQASWETAYARGDG